MAVTEGPVVQRVRTEICDVSCTHWAQAGSKCSQDAAGKLYVQEQQQQQQQQWKQNHW